MENRSIDKRVQLKEVTNMSSKPAILGGSPVFSSPLPFARPTLPSFEDVEQELRDIFQSGMITKGPILDKYEYELTKHLKVPYALGVVNGTAGLYMLLKALDLKGEVIVPSFSFMASFHIIEQAGLKPIFVDCERDTFTIDPAQVEKAITQETSLIIAVNIFGNPPDMDSLETIAKKNNLKLMTDSAHSFGTLYKGRPMGSFGDGEVFSTSATKLIATGEGGVVSTPHKEVDEFIREFREYGNKGDYDCAIPGINGRLSELHALIGLKSLMKLDDLAISRNKIAKQYIDGLKDIPGITFQKIRENCRSSYKDFGIIVDENQFGINRDRLSTALQAEGVGTRKYFHPPGHRQIFYKQKYPEQLENELNNTDYIANHSLMLPIYSHMKTEQVEKVVEAIRKIYNSRSDLL
jgi:dTDP-4-amino-4,6-dideoxygalactose transaminase